MSGTKLFARLSTWPRFLSSMAFRAVRSHPLVVLVVHTPGVGTDASSKDTKFYGSLVLLPQSLHTLFSSFSSSSRYIET